MRCKLSDICSYRKGKIEVKRLNNITYISTENMLPNKGGITEASSLPSIVLTQEYRKGDVLVSNIRPYFKKIWQAKYDGGCSNDVLVFTPNPMTDKDFLYYVLANDEFFLYSMATSKGTKMPRGDKDSIMQYEIPDIGLDRQRKIASVLKSLDDKIQLNIAINKNLEQQIEMVLLKTINDTDTQPVKLGDYLYIKGRIGWKGLKNQSICQFQTTVSSMVRVSLYRALTGTKLVTYPLKDMRNLLK